MTLEQLHRELLDIRHAMQRAEANAAHILDAIPADHQDSARNLIHYMAMRAFDVAALQLRLRELGLSSLGRAEPAAMRTINAVAGVLSRLAGQPDAYVDAPIDFNDGERILAARLNALMGPPAPDRDVRIMVTMPAAAAEEPAVVRDLLRAGMDVMRINGAHDTPADWARMAAHKTQAESELGRTCRIMVDVPGPKLRTGPAPKPLVLCQGDRLTLYRDATPARRAILDPDGGVAAPASIGCLAPDALKRVAVGHRVWFDDGRIGAVARAINDDAIELEVTHAGPRGEKLRADKGVNLPDTPLDLPLIDHADEQVLAFAAEHADSVAMSFVRSGADVAELQTRLRELDAERLGVILKIETRAAFERFPEIMLTALRSRVVGVMVARGDLAIEVGYERLAEVQEEVLWMCEAAHVPVIWATQVLETLAKKGRASRAEITDAAMAQRAECVMLNKGPYILHAVRTLDDILRRMRRHQVKKRPLLTPLGVARRFVADIDAADAPAHTLSA